MKNGSLTKQPALRGALFGEEITILSLGVAVAAPAQSELGLMGLWLFGPEKLKQKYGPSAVKNETLMCLGNSESRAGADAANIAMQAKKVDGGWLLNGTKAYVTNGLISDMAVITAVSDPHALRNSRMSMFLVDHKFPTDAWASSLGEGTQDVQKLVIFREVMKKYSSSG
jgi:alkylation response protein AidB-like acyl-CoA dehydrogenase